MQAEMSMGLHQHEESDERTDLRVARHSIDLLAVLQDKTRNNLSLEEQRLLDNSVTELRFRYIQAFEAQQKKAAQAASE